MRAYANDLLTFYLLRRPVRTPPAFWRHIAGSRCVVGGLLLAMTAWMLFALFSPALGGRFVPRFAWPLWSLPLAAFALFVLGKFRKWLYRDRKKRFFERVWKADFDVCLECGFHLAGLPDQHRCPECGRPFFRAAAADAWKQWMENEDDENPLRRATRGRWFDFNDS